MHLPIVFALLVILNASNGAPSQNVEARDILDNYDIVMGKDANIEDIPYQIAIEYLRMHKCGGAIISEDWLITTAHCIDPRISGKPSFKRIRAGSTTSIPVVDTDGEIYQIADLKYHPRWDPMTIDYDVGVVRVSSRFVYSDRIRAIKMFPVGFKEGIFDYNEVFRVTGWGDTQTGGPFTVWRLRAAEVPLVKRARCSELFEGAHATTTKITPRMMCGAGIGNGGPCQGDSGGLMLYGQYLVGLSSWAIACCKDPTYPTVFTNVLNDEIRKFVQETTQI